jgi:signal peptidase I
MSLESRATNAETFAMQNGTLAQAGSPQKSRQPLVTQIWQCLVVATLALASYFLVSHYLFQSVRVVGVSMSPTLYDSQMYLLNRWIYLVRAPERADIVVLRDPLDNGFSVKRVVALPGDTVFLKDGVIFVNGRKIKESYLKAGTPTYAAPNYREQLFKCGPDHYLVLGDNRLNSVDGRVYGPIPRQNILGMLMR